MAKLGERIQTGDWKQEKHVPAIECPSAIKTDELFEVKVGLGKAVAHPNTTEHHIRWISVFFHPEGEKFTYQVAHFDFTAHGESVEGPNKGPNTCFISVQYSWSLGGHKGNQGSSIVI